MVVVVVVVTEERAGGVEDVEKGGASVDVKDVSVDGIEGEMTVVVVEEVILSDEEEKGVEAEGVVLDSEGVAWAGFDSSHRPFLQQGDSRKSNRQEETLSTTTTATGLKTHAQFRYTTRKVMQTAHRAKMSWRLLLPTALEARPGMVTLLNLSTCSALQRNICR